MTETEYVQTIRAVAQAYCDAFRKHDGALPESEIKLARRWENIKIGMAASTVIDMADAWLDRHEVGS